MYLLEVMLTLYLNLVFFLHYGPYLGCVSRAGQAAFASSKFAVEAFSDSLRQEMLKWGVFVSIVQPAYFPGNLLTFL